MTFRAAIVAKDAGQFDEQNGDDAPTVSDSQVAAWADDATPDHANGKSHRGRKPKPAIEPFDLQGLGRTSFGSFSESVRVFDPEPLKEIAAELAEQLPQPSQGRFDSIGKTLTAVDGSVVDTISLLSDGSRLREIPALECDPRRRQQLRVSRSR